MYNFLTSVGIIGGADGPTAILVSDGSSFVFEPMNFISNLSYMGYGMLGIFVVIGLIMATTAFLNRAFSDKKDDEQ